MKQRRVVITGIAAITPFNMDKDTFEKKLFTLADTPIIHEIENFIVAAEELIPFNTLRRIAEYSALALYAHIQAVADSGLVISKENLEKIGSIMNTVYGPLKVTEGFLNTLIKQGPKQVSPNDFANTVINCATGQVSIFFQLKGISSTLVGSSAINYAYDFIKQGKSTAILVSGVDEYHPIVEANYENLNYPFTENSCCLVLEDHEHAVHRKAKIYAEIIGCGMGTDTAQIKKIDVLNGIGLEVSLESALLSANTAIEHANLIYASSPQLTEVFPKEKSITAKYLPVANGFAWKSKFGESLGCNEIMAAIIACHFFDKKQFINSEEEMVIKPITNKDFIAVNSNQPGGNWSTIILKGGTH